MGDTRHKDAHWNIRVNEDGTTSFEAAQLTVLMDIRDELKLVNARLQCRETMAIPAHLRRIASLLAKRGRKKS